jgi:hypothetical protein
LFIAKNVISRKFINLSRNPSPKTFFGEGKARGEEEIQLKMC